MIRDNRKAVAEPANRLASSAVGSEETYALPFQLEPVASRHAAATDLKRRVLNFLASRNESGLRNLEVEVEGDAVLLRGRVNTLAEKALASHCCSRVAGVVRVVDGIYVVPDTSVRR